MNNSRKMIFALVTGIAAITVISLATIGVISAERPVGISVSKWDPAPVPAEMKSITLNQQQLSNIPVLGKAIAQVDRNANVQYVTPFWSPAPFEAQITLTEANLMMQALPFTEFTKPDETFRTYYTIAILDEKAYLVALYFA